MRRPDALRLLLVSAFAVAASRAAAVEPAPAGDGAPVAGSCLIVDYSVKAGDGYTWYYCPSFRVFVRPGQRWITNFDTGIETRVLEKDRKVRPMPISVKREQRRAETEAFKQKPDGLRQVQLKSLEPKQPGMSQIVVKAKRWFSAAAANDPNPANTRLTITVGAAQCYTHAATKKTD